MKLGVVLPSFQISAEPAHRALAAAVEAGIDGCFCYDHLWPLNAPGRPALAPFPLLGSLARASATLTLGTLVARVGLASKQVLEEELLSLHALLGSRFIAGIGAGDHKSAGENWAYGIPVKSAAERREQLVALHHRLVAQGVRTWIGGGGSVTNEMALEANAVLNLWSASPERVAEYASRGEVTWGGALPRERAFGSALLRSLEDAGATWAIFGWMGSLEPLLEAARDAGLEGR